jgi:hypothetical protein
MDGTWLERFWRRVSRGDDPCWLWTGCIGGNGYGRMWLNGKDVMAHRVSWLIHKGVVPDGLLVLHRCDVRHCVNPDHLFLGTTADNVADKIAKGRHCYGARNGRSKLNDAAALSIIQRASDGETLTSLARAFGVSRTVIRHIVRGRLWGHVSREGVWTANG